MKKYRLPVEPDTGGLPWVFGPTSPWFSIGSSVDLVGLIRSMALSFSPSTPEMSRSENIPHCPHVAVHLIESSHDPLSSGYMYDSVPPG